MKILFLVDDFSGGAGNIIQLISTEYAKDNEVTVALLHKHTEQRYPCENVKFKILKETDKPKGSLKVFCFLINWINKTIKEFEPDVVISFITQNNILAGLTLLNKDTPLIACERVNPILLDNLTLPWRVLLKIAYQRADVISVQFDSFKHFENNKYIEKSICNPNYVMNPLYKKNEGIDHRHVRFVSCGRLDPMKQFEEMIHIFVRFHNQYPNSELNIYGQGPLKSKLENMVHESGIQEFVHINEHTSNVYEVLVNSDIYLMTSKQEGFPNALSEAMAVGLPSVSYCCHDGILELTDQQRRGLVSEPGNQDVFLQKMEQLVTDEELYLCISNAAKEVVDLYSMENVKKTWDNCIETAIQRRKR